MVICHLRSTTGFYGAERVLQTLVANTGRDPVQHLACIVPAGASSCALADAVRDTQRDVGIFPSSATVDFGLVNRLADYCTSRGVTILHTHDYKSAVYGWLVAWRLGLRRVATVHGWTAESLRLRAYEWLERRLLRGYDRVIVVSDAQRARLQREGVRPNRISLIPNGLRMAPAAIRSPEANTVPFRWVCVGRLSPEKGLFVLLDAFGQVLRRHPDAELLILGAGPLDAALCADAAARGIDHCIIWVGFTTEVARYLATAQAYVSASFTEGLPMAQLEAMAAGLPVVATAVGSVSDVLAGGGGIAVPPQDPGALAESMLRMMDDDEARAACARAARETVANEYSADAQWRRYTQVYAQVSG